MFTICSNHLEFGRIEYAPTLEAAIIRARKASSYATRSSGHAPQSPAFRPSRTGRASVFPGKAIREGNKSGWLGVPNLEYEDGWANKEGICICSFMGGVQD